MNNVRPHRPDSATDRENFLKHLGTNTVKLDYNEQLGTGQTCSELVIIWLVCVVNVHLGLKNNRVRYDRVFL